MTILVGGASTQSRARRPLPTDAVRGITQSVDGAYERVHFFREDGSWYGKRLLSWIGGQWGGLWGSGLNNLPAPIFEAVTNNISQSHGSFGHRAEYDLADALGEVYAPYINGGGDLACRFFQNGGDATAAAVRIARGVTARDAFASYGYHGAALDFAHKPDFNGQPMVNVFLCRQFEWGDEESMQRAAKDAACAIVEVPALDNEMALGAFLRECRMACDDYGIPLILDEVVTGTRIAIAGASEKYGVKPDMVCVGKSMSAIGGISAVIGRRDLVDDLNRGTFYSTTFGGSPFPCAVATATLRWLIEHKNEVFGESGHLYKIGKALKNGYNSIGIKTIGQPERSIFAFDSDTEWLEFCSRMIEKSIMVHRPNFSNLVHTMVDVETTITTANEVLTEWKR